MFWNLNPIQKPLAGSTRIKRRFALVPVRIEDKRYWLHRYYELWGYVVEEVQFAGEVPGTVLQFDLGRWVLLSKSAKNMQP